MGRGQGFRLKLGLNRCEEVEPGAESARWDLQRHSVWDERSARGEEFQASLWPRKVETGQASTDASVYQKLFWPGAMSRGGGERK